MDRNRFMMIGAVLAAVIVLAGGFLLGVQPQLKAAADAHAQESTVTAQNESLATSLALLRKQYDKMSDKKSELSDLESTVPAGVESGAMITELNGIAKASNVTLSNIQFGTAAAYVPPVSTAPAATATASASASPSASAIASPSASASTPAAPAVTTDSLITAANFTSIPLTVQIKGSYADALTFLQGVRDGDRLFMINSITSAAATADSGDSSTTSANSTDTINWTFGGLVYALTDAQSAQKQQQTTTNSSTASSATDGSSTDTAAGK